MGPRRSSAAPIRAFAVLASLLTWSGVGCTDHLSVAHSTEPDTTHTLTIGDVRCVPDVPGGATVEAGADIECVFLVRGTSGQRITLGCENDEAQMMPCSPASPLVSLAMPSSDQLPVVQGVFRMSTDVLLIESTASVVWVARDGPLEARYTLTPTIVPDDQLNAAPSVEVRCGEPDAGAITAQAGDAVDCLVFITDPDPDDRVLVDVRIVEGPPPSDPPPAFPNLVEGPGIPVWRWQVRATDSVGRWVYRFTAQDDVGATGFTELEITVQ